MRGRSQSSVKKSVDLCVLLFPAIFALLLDLVVQNLLPGGNSSVHPLLFLFLLGADETNDEKDEQDRGDTGEDDAKNGPATQLVLRDNLN